MSVSVGLRGVSIGKPVNWSGAAIKLGAGPIGELRRV
jgi:hypothetical protein